MPIKPWDSDGVLPEVLTLKDIIKESHILECADNFFSKVSQERKKLNSLYSKVREKKVQIC